MFSDYTNKYKILSIIKEIKKFTTKVSNYLTKPLLMQRLILDYYNNICLELSGLKILTIKTTGRVRC